MSSAAAGGGGGGGNTPPSPYNTRPAINELYSSRLPMEATRLIANYTGNWWEDVLRKAMGGLTYTALFTRPMDVLPYQLDYYIKENPKVLDAFLAYLNSEQFKALRGTYAETYKQRLLKELLQKTLSMDIEHFKRVIDAGAVADSDILSSILQRGMADKLEYLLSKGLDPNTVLSTFTRETLLIRAVDHLHYYNYFDVAKLLLEAGAGPARIQTEFRARKPGPGADSYARNNYIQEIRAIVTILFILTVNADAIPDAVFSELLGKISPDKMRDAIKMFTQLVKKRIITPLRPSNKLKDLLADSLGPEEGMEALKVIIGLIAYTRRLPALIAFRRAWTPKGGKRMQPRGRRRTRRRN